MTLPLENRRILVPESRELDLFARMLEAQGAIAIRCPMVTMLDVEDKAPVEAWLRRLAEGQFDDLILLTGEGLRRLLAVAKEAGIEAETVAALGRLRTVTRGPKPARALREIGLTSNLAAVEPTTEGVIQSLIAEKLTGRRIGVQLYPDNPNEKLLGFLRQAGATPEPVLPYRYASDAETAQVETAIEDMAAGKIDLVAFTSTPQIVRLQKVVDERHMESKLRNALARTKIAAIGPVVAAALETIGVRAAIMPDSFHMKPLVNAICAALNKP